MWFQIIGAIAIKDDWGIAHALTTALNPLRAGDLKNEPRYARGCSASRLHLRWEAIRVGGVAVEGTAQMSNQQDTDTGYPPSELLQCLACGRYFAQSNAYSTHVRSCRPQRKRMASALEAAKETYRRKKMRTASNPPDQQQEAQPSPQAVMPTNEVSFRGHLTDDFTHHRVGRKQLHQCFRSYRG